MAPGPLLLSFVLARGTLVHRKLESDLSAKAAESTKEMERRGNYCLLCTRYLCVYRRCLTSTAKGRSVYFGFDVSFVL